VADPLRVLAVTNLWPEGGSFRGVFVKEQVEALRRLGHRVDVEVVAQARGKSDYLLAIPRVRRAAASGDYQVIHVHYGLAGLAARFAGRTPRVLSLYGSDVNDPRQWRLTRLGRGGSAARIYVSRRLADSAGDPAGDVIPNGVDLSVFTPQDRAAARAALGIGPDQPVVLFGALPSNAVKRYDVFRAVVDRLGARELVLSAPGQPIADLVAKFAAADLLLFTSRQGSEGSPTVVKEAAVMGLPVVSVDVGDVAEILDGVSPSAVVPFGPDLVDRLATEAAQVLAAGTRSNGRERLGWLDSPAIAQRIVDVYHRVAS
jgi:glycosyltransferase involved in cell wall biosynthesis